MKVTLAIFLLVAATFALNVRFSDMPQDYQLYPRDADNKGNVLVRGTVLDSAKDSVVVLVTRNGAPYGRQRATLTYQGDSAGFQFTLPVPAELAEFGVECLVDGESAASADSIVAGDVYIIGGQSNSTTWDRGGTLNYIREVRLSDSAWGYGGAGAWGQEIGNKIIQYHHVPVCILNGGVWGAPISELQRNDADPMDLNTAYGRTLFRAFRGKVQHAVKAAFWYQGESEAGYGAETYYPVLFARLRDSWMQDFTGLQKIYIFQINTWLSAGAREEREALRRISHQYDNVEIMSTLGVPGYGGHYGGQGYYELAARMFRLAARDLYGSADTVDITPPEIRRAFYASGAKDKIYLDFDQALTWNGIDTIGGYLKDYFALNDSNWQAVDSCWFEQGNRRITLKLKAPSAASTISYMRDYYDLVTPAALTGPCLMNPRNVAALTFAQFPLEDAGHADTAAVTVFELAAPKETLAVFESMQAWGVAHHGAVTDTNRNVIFSTTDTFVLRVELNGFIRAMNPGSGFVIAVKEGFRDTLRVTVGNAFAAMRSMAFGPPERRLMAGDSMAAGLLGDFSDGTHQGLFSLDTLAAFQYDTGLLQMEKGMIKAGPAGGNTEVVALFAGQRCTLALTIPVAPSFVRRINFQPRGDSITGIPDWAIDSGTGYDAGKGYGWAAPGAGGQHSPLVANHLRATFAWNDNGDYRIDCPDGNYLVRICTSVWLWAEPATICAASETLLVNPNGHSGDGIATEQQIWIGDSRISVTGGAGLRLNIYGGIAYLVLISDDGADLDLAAKDGDFTPDPLFTETEKGNGRLAAGLIRKPMACPNPFNPVTTVRFGLPAGVSADYVLFDIRGRRIMSQSLLQSRSARVREVVLDFNQSNGRGFASGTYFGRLVCSDGKRYSHALVLIK